ncbi:MAG: DUF547 domain-containing protein [Bdellovibrionales bacterium]|nr:DUF547 domain-containing protein [Bdellovibrionales bacterium]
MFCLKNLFLHLVLFSTVLTPLTAFSNAAFDHNYKSYEEILKKFVVVSGPVSTVKYKSLKTNRTELDQFTQSLSSVTQKQFNEWTQPQQIAFLINAYNALTLKLIIDHYPVKSIKKIGSFFSSPWKKEFFSLFGKKSFLDHIEHGILRKKYSEPRVHFAVNCASIGCPALANFAYTAEKLEEQLQQQTKLFLSDSKRNTLNTKSKTLRLSKIFDWFEEDFSKNKNSVAKFIAPHITGDKTLQKSIIDGTYKIEFHSYDWNLNDQR